MATLKFGFFVFAAICFLLAAAGVTSKVNLESLGLLFLTIALLL